MPENYDTKKELKELTESRFMNNNARYRMLKTKSKCTVYAKVAPINRYVELCHYTDNHETFLQALSSFTKTFESLEATLKEYYNYANSSEYKTTAANAKVLSLCKSLKNVHPFFCHQNTALLYIRSVLIYYHYRTLNYRFLMYLEAHTSEQTPLPNFMHYRDSEILSRSESETYDIEYDLHLNSIKERERDFFIYDQIFTKKLFDPIFQLLYPHPNEKGRMKKSLNDLLTNYPKYFSKGLRFNLFLYEDTRNSLKIEVASQRILWQLKIINDVFSNYFSIFMDAFQSHIITNSFQQYALLLTNNARFYDMIDSCTFYSTHQSMHKIIKYHHNDIFSHEYSSHKNGAASIIRYDNDLRSTLTDNLFDRIKDSLDSNTSVQQQLSNELENYYPSKLDKYNGAEVIEFTNFEQLLALELLDIISQNVIIKKCKHCGCYFITAAKKRKYCDVHKNNQKLYQHNYEKKSRSMQSSLQSTYQKYDICFYKRCQRKKISESNYLNWKQSASALIQKYTSQNIPSDNFIYDLDEVCKKHHLKPPRKYSRSH